MTKNFGSYSLISILLLFFPLLSYPQTIIKEKVKVSPKQTLSKIPKTVQNHTNWRPCSPPPKTDDLYNPLQAVWLYSTFPLNPGRQDLRSRYGDYGVDTSKYYTFKIVSGGNYFHFQRDYYDGYGWISEQITDSVRVKGKDLWPKAWDYNKEAFVTIYDSVKCIDRDYAPFYNNCYYYEYTVHFNGIWNREQEVVYSVTSDTTYYVHTFIKRPTYTLSTDNIQDTLLYGLKREIPIKLEINECRNDSLAFVPRNGGSLNKEAVFSIRITEGLEYGSLSIENYDYGDEFMIDYSTLRKGLYLITKGSDNPDSTATVKIEITCNDADVTPHTIYSELLIKHNPNPPPGLLMRFDKNVLMPYDSTRIYLQFVTDEGEILDFSPYYNFDVRIEQGTDYGVLYYEMWDEYATELYNIGSEGLWYYSTQNISQNMVDVVIYAEESGGIIGGKINPGNSIKNNPVKRLKKNNKSLQQTQSMQQVDKLETRGELQIAGPVLLGETKYLGLQKKNDNSAYRIAEIPTVYGNEPNFPLDAGGWKWIKNNSVWNDDPISVSNSGKSCIYWEKKFFDKKNNSNPVLKNGIIRVIGRYWEEGKEEDYRVTLKAQCDNKTIERDLKVGKPGKLLTEVQIPTYKKARDIFDNEYSIDELCIKYGGLYGIPPQMLKGQMATESAIKTFNFNDGTSGSGFAPSYRYEPFTTQFDPVVNSLISQDNPFVVTNGSMGKPGSASVPSTSEHKHVSFVHYYETPKTIWDIVDDNSQLVNENNPSTYVYRYKTGKRKGCVKSNDYNIINTKYQEKLIEAENIYRYKMKEKSKELTQTQQIEVNDSARVALVKFLKHEWQVGGIKGLTNIYAQTRIASSYGLLQILYITVVNNRDYPISNNDRPENINDNSVGFDYMMKHLESKFGTNGFSLTKPDNWESTYKGRNKAPSFPKPGAGFEEALEVMFYKWNPGKKDENGNAIYHKLVLDNSKKFLPRR